MELALEVFKHESGTIGFQFIHLSLEGTSFSGQKTGQRERLEDLDSS